MRRLLTTLCVLALVMVSAAIARAQTVTANIPVGTLPQSEAVNPVTNTIYVANFTSSNVTVVSGATGATTTIAVGTDPSAIAVNPVTNTIYVANQGSSNVTVINGATNTVTATIAAGTEPWAVAVNPVTNTIYVANEGSSNVTVINGATNSTTTVATGTNPYAVAVNPVTNEIYVANYNSNNVTVINGATNSTATVAAGTNPWAIAVNPVTNEIYVANHTGSNVTVISGANNTVTTTVTAGTLPYSIAVNPVTNTIYVVNQGSGNVTVINGATNASATVAAGTNPFALAVNPVTNKIYVANLNSANATVIDGATNTTTTVAAGTSPYAVAANPVTNKVYVANEGSANVTVIDGATNSTATVAVGTVPFAAAVNPATNTIYVLNGSSANVTVVNGGNNSVTATVATGSNPQAVTVNPVTDQIYVPNLSSNNVTEIDGATNAVTATIAVGTEPVAVGLNPVTNKIYTANDGSNNVTVIDGATDSTVATVTAGTNPDAVAVNLITNTVYVANYGSNSVTVINGATNTVTATVAVGTEPRNLVLNPVTNAIYVANFGSGSVTVINGATNTVTATVTAGTQPWAAAVNPITNKIYVANEGSNNVTVIDGATNSATAIAVGTLPIGVAVNPVTNKIYVANEDSDNVTVIDGATNTATTVAAGTNPNGVAVNPATNTIYVANDTSDTVTVLTEEQLQPVPLVTAITTLPGNQTTSLTPTFTFTVTSSYTPTAPTPQAVYYQVDTWQGPWTLASGANPTFSGQTATLSLGPHVLYAYAVDGQEAGIDGAGRSGQVTIGAIAAYPFVVMLAGTTASHTSLSSSLNPSDSGETITLTATVGGGSGNVLPGGTVTFYYGTDNLGSGTLDSSQQATLQLSNLPIGSDSLTAQYFGDSNFSGSTSPILPQTVNPALTLASQTLPSGTVGAPYSATLQASGGTAPYTWLGSGLPPGLTLSTAGVLSGTPTSTGTFNSSVEVTDATGANAFNQITVGFAAISVTTTSLLGGVTGTAYSQTLQEIGGIAPYTWSIASGSLPAGLSLSAAGAISGTPTAAGTSNFTVGVKDSTTPTALTATSGQLSIAVVAALKVTTTSLPGGAVGTAYSQTLQATGGTAPYTWSIATGALPAGLSLSAATGAITGTPTTAGIASFTVGVKDANALTATSGQLSIAVVAALTVTTTSLPGGAVGTAYSQTLQATGGTAPYTWSIATGALPAGLSLSSAGAITGTPTTSGTSSFTVSVKDANALTATSSLSIAVVSGLTVTTTNLPGGAVGTAYSQTLQAAGGTAPYTWSIATGSLPAGLSLSSAGAITGTPTTSGTSSFTVSVKDANALTATSSLSIAVVSGLTVTTTNLPGGVVGTAYSQTLQALGGTAPYTWSIVSGSLPAGLSLSTAGAITGTPTAAGTSSFTVSVKDANALTATGGLSIVVGSALTVTTTSLPSGVIGTPYNQTLQAAGGTAPYTWALTTGIPPPGLSLSAAGVITGTPTTAGTYNGTVTVTDANGVVSTSGLLSLVVGAPSSAPTCQPPMIQNSTTNPLAVSATSNCTDSQSSITSTSINWGDGSSPLSGATGSHTYTAAGIYSITVSATNGSNLTNTASASVTVTAPITASVAQGQAAQATANVAAPLGVPSVQVTYQCTSADGPSGVQTLAFYGLSCNINNAGSSASVTLTSTPTPISISVKTTASSTTAAVLRPVPRARNAGRLYAAVLMVPCIMLLGVGPFSKRRRRLCRFINFALLGLLMSSLLACGGGGGGGSSSTTPPPQSQTATPLGTYTVTGIGTSSSGSQSTITLGFTVS